MVQCVGFRPVARKGAKVLILGSLPGAESLRQCQYYAYRQNAFWKIMEGLVGTSPEAPYNEKLQKLMDHKIALWDVCKAAYRPGSLDSSIESTSVVPNNFAAFLKSHPDIALICFNGKHAAKLYRNLVLPKLGRAKADIPLQILPSTSPAHAGMTLAIKASHWRKALGEIIELG